METKRFLQSVLPRNGWYCVLAIHAETGQRKQKFYDSLDHLIDATYSMDANNNNAYYALASFSETGSREATNVAHKRAFYLDLDCGPEDPKKFPDQGTALKELRRFCKVARLPKPIVVNSGRGVHVYWPLNEDVTYEEWLPVAERLKAVCRHHGFAADPAVTSDAARVLRMPGSRNHKDNPPKEVQVLGMEAVPPIPLDKFAELLGADAIPVPVKLPVSMGPNSVLDALIGSREHYFKDIMVKTGKGKGCAQLAYIYRNQETMPEPLWRAGLSIAKHCVDADKAATRISQGHPEFTPDEMFDKLDRIKGPYLCARFDEYNPDVCTKCALWGKIKSPIVLGAKVREATEEDNIVVAPSGTLPNAPEQEYVIPVFPRPYFRGSKGGVYVRSADADGGAIEKCIYHNDLYVVRRVHDGTQDALVFRLHLPRDGVREFTVPQVAVTSKEEFRKAISAKGVTTWGKDLEELMAYTLRWTEELQAKSAADTAHNQFGWTSDEAKSFIVGNQEIFPSRIDFNPPSMNTAALFPAFEPAGTLEGWKENAEFFNKEGMELYQLVVCLCFGSVLMHNSPVHGAMLHLYSKESGLGKTTAALLGLAIWGAPESLVLGQDDTANFKMLRAETYRSLPYVLDELTNMRPKEVSDFAYAVPRGSQKGRMGGGGNVERVRGGTWRLLSVSTGNTNLIDRASLYKAVPKAEAMRILQARVDTYFNNTGDKSMTDDFASSVISHYGHAGIVFLQHYMQNKEQYAAAHKKVQLRVDEAAGLSQPHRFWSELVSRSLTAGMVANKIGLLNYDMGKLFKFCVKLLKQNKNDAEDMNSSVSQIVSDFFSEHHGNVLWIKSTSDLRGTTAAGLDSIIIPEVNPRAKLVARYETDTKVAFILVKPFKAWCTEQQIDFGACLSHLIDTLGAKKRRMRITKGTHMNLPPQDTIEVKFDGLTYDDEEGDE